MKSTIESSSGRRGRGRESERQIDIVHIVRAEREIEKEGIWKEMEGRIIQVLVCT